MQAFAERYDPLAFQEKLRGVSMNMSKSFENTEFFPQEDVQIITPEAVSENPKAETPKVPTWMDPEVEISGSESDGVNQVSEALAEAFGASEC